VLQGLTRNGTAEWRARSDACLRGCPVRDVRYRPDRCSSDALARPMARWRRTPGACALAPPRGPPGWGQWARMAQRVGPHRRSLLEPAQEVQRVIHDDRTGAFPAPAEAPRATQLRRERTDRGAPHTGGRPGSGPLDRGGTPASEVTPHIRARPAAAARPQTSHLLADDRAATGPVSARRASAVCCPRLLPVAAASVSQALSRVVLVVGRAIARVAPPDLSPDVTPPGATFPDDLAQVFTQPTCTP
jgi:hypothetical protein